MTAGATSASSPGIEELLANVPPEETPDLSGAFPRLDEARIRTLEALGERRTVTRGEVLIVEGEPEDTFPVVLSGRVAVVEGLGCPDQRLVRVHGPGRFLGVRGPRRTGGFGGVANLVGRRDVEPRAETDEVSAGPGR